VPPASESDSGVAEETVQDLAGGGSGEAWVDQHVVLAPVDAGAEAVALVPELLSDDDLVDALANELVLQGR
jgi:hypothetical protein